MNVVDALCERCGRPIAWLVGSPRLCETCLVVEVLERYVSHQALDDIHDALAGVEDL